jgi:2',3'-cyclic-nucleotide 3'-phosphodiesterase
MWRCRDASSTTENRTAASPSIKLNAMPSLWLLPPSSDSPLNGLLASLIAQTSSHFHSTHSFLPHVTLTSEISPEKYSSDPQAWLDSLDLPSGDEVQVKFKQLASDDVFVRKLYIQCHKTDGIKKLAGACRQEVEGFGDDSKAKEWANYQYNPHVSLLYHDCPQVGTEGLSEVEQLARKAGVDHTGESGYSGWSGGRIVLVPTDKPIGLWEPIASREL